MSTPQTDRRRGGPGGRGDVAVGTGTPPLTCCCPTPRLTDLSPAAWLDHWALEVYGQWCGGRAQPPLPGVALVVNAAGTIFSSPHPATIRTELAPLAQGPTVPHSVAAIYALSVLDRVAAPKLWIRAAAQQLPPGGLFACSFAYWNAEGEDCAVGAELRRRIYSLKTWQELAWFILPQEGFALLGAADWLYRGDACGDHTIATVVGVRTAAPVTGRKGVGR